MLQTYLRTARRHLWKHKFYTGLNIFGLSLGIAGGLVLYLFISYHLSFDRYHHKASQLYRIVLQLHLQDGPEIYDAGSPVGMADSLQKELPAIQETAVLMKVHAFTANVGNKAFAEHENIAYADQHWFNLFDYTWEEGNPATALSAPNTVVLTRRLATKYFGQQDAVGQVIRLDNKYNVTVTGVLKDYPPYTDLQTDMFISRASLESFYPGYERSMHQSWNAFNSTTNIYISLPPTVPVQRAEAAITRLRDRHFDADVASAYIFHLQPLRDLHFDSRYGGVIQRPLLFALALAGLLLVLIACFNFINLATAQSARRAREIGTRKVLGSTAGAIFGQFMTETALIALLAAALAAGWLLLGLPILNTWLQIRLAFTADAWLCMGVLLTFIILAGGSYPALILSRFRPMDIIRQQTNSLQAGFYRKGLILLQNVVVQVLIIATLIITLQVKHLKTSNLGFDKSAMLMVNIPDPDKSKLEFLRQQWLNTRDVLGVSYCFRAPSSPTHIGGSVSYDNRNWENFSVSSAIGDANYQPTFQLPLVTGRNLLPSDTVREVLVNETLVRKLGQTPEQVIGHRLLVGELDNRPGTIVGVVKDFNMHTLYDPIAPLLITTQRDKYELAAVKLSPGADREAIRKAWQAVYPNNVFEYHYLDAQIDSFYHKEDLLNKLINATAGMAILISCLGLLGLISFLATQRTREIGIRKVLGAGTAGIVYLLSKDFLQLVLLAMVLAMPLAWYFMHRWLLGFAFRIDISWWIYLLAGFVSLFIATVTVSFQAIRAAIANPAESLKAE